MTEHGTLIREVRINKGLTQRQLASLVGTTDSHIARIEKGYQRGSFYTLAKIATKLELPKDILLKKAGFEIDGIGQEKFEFDPETYEFASLPIKVKKLLLDCAPMISKHLES